MKTLIVLCVFLFAHNSYGKHISQQYFENVAHSSAVCKSVEFDNGNGKCFEHSSLKNKKTFDYCVVCNTQFSFLWIVEFNHYISNHARAQLCAQKIHNYNATGLMPSNVSFSQNNFKKF